MIEVIHYQNKKYEESFLASIEIYYDEVRKLLPDLPETLQIYFSDQNVIPETGVGGYAYSRNIITLSIDPNFKDTKKQTDNIRPTIYHEAFHQYQDFTGESEFRGAVEAAIYEGMATVFERDIEGTAQPYGDYSHYSQAELTSRVTMLESLGDAFIEDERVWQQWAFYNDDLDERWILYRVGAWIVDTALHETNQTILDFKDKTAKDIYLLYSGLVDSKSST